MKIKNKPEFPNPNQLSSFFSSFENIQALNEQEIKEIWKNISFLPRYIHYLDEIDFDYFRARPANDVKQDITLPSTFSHPPVKCAPQDRANIKGYPVLYVSLNEVTSLIEAKCKDFFYLAVWGLKGKSTIKLNSLLFTDLHSENPMKMISDDSYNFLNEIKDLSSVQKDDLRKLYTLYSELFLKDNKNITSLIGHKILYKNEFKNEYQPDAFIYPSIRVDKKGCNFAFHPEFVKNNFELRYVFFGKINSFNKQTFDINLTIKNFGITVKDRIKWYQMKIEITDVNILSAKKNVTINKTEYRNFFVEFDDKIPLIDFCDLEITKNKLSLLKNDLKKINALCAEKERSLSDNFTVTSTYNLLVENKFQVVNKNEIFAVDKLVIKYVYKFSKNIPKNE